MVNCFLLSTEYSDPEIEFSQLTCIEKDYNINQKYILPKGLFLRILSFKPKYSSSDFLKIVSEINRD